MESNKLLNDLFLTIRNDYAGWNAKQKRHNPTPFVTMLGQAYYDRRMSSLLVLQAVSQYCAGMRDRNLKFQLVQEGYAPFSRGFSVRRCAQGMVVDAVTQETRLHPGDRVLAINRTAPERIVKNLPNPLLAADEPEREQWNGYLKMARDITVRHPDGTEELLELARYPAEADTAPALYQPDPETVVLDPGTLNDADALEAFVEEHRAQLDGCTRLVLDLRDSNGDDEEALLPLLPYITAKDTTAEELFGDRRIRTNYTRMNCARLIHMLTPCLVDEDPEVRQMAQQLFETLAMDAKCTAKLTPAVSTVPSYTQLGMAALLPHVSLEIQPDSTVTILGKKTVGTAARESILQAAEKNSSCIQFDQMQNMRRDELRSYFSGKTLVYVYHNQIDARGDEARTENEVFSACEEAVEELYKEIRRLTDNANIRHFIVTADHGFLYKHDPIMESDKVINLPQAEIKNKRFMISDDTQPVAGAVGYRLGDVLDTADNRTVYTPLGSSIFKCAGGGQNYVHGGASVQEMLVPVLDVRTQAGHVETQKATVSLLPTPETLMDGKITLKFLQTELVTDTVLPAVYEVFVVNAMDNQVSTKRTIRSDKTVGCADEERRTEVTLTLKKLPYSRENDYYFLLTDKDTGAVMEKRSVKIDIAGAKKEE